MTTETTTSPAATPVESNPRPSFLRLAVGLALLLDALFALPSWGGPPDAPGLLAGTAPLFSLGPGTTLALCHLQVALALLVILGVATRGGLLTLAGLSLIKLLTAWPWLRLDHLLLVGLLPLMALNPGDSRLALDPQPTDPNRRNRLPLIGWLVTVVVAVGILMRLVDGRMDGGTTARWLSWLPQLRPGLSEGGLLTAARTTTIVMIVADLLLLVALRVRSLRVLSYIVLLPVYLALAGAALMSRHGDWLLHAVLMPGVLIALQPPRVVNRLRGKKASNPSDGGRLLQPESSTTTAAAVSLGGVAVATLAALPWILHYNGGSLAASLRPSVTAYALVWLAIVIVGVTGMLSNAHTTAQQVDAPPPRALRAGLYFGTLVAVVALAALLLRVGGTSGRYSVHWTRALLARGDTTAAGKLAMSRSLRKTQPLAAARARVLVTPILLRHGKLERAKAALKFGGRLLPNHDAELNSARGALAMRKGDPQKAIRHFRRALLSELTPQHLLRLAAAHTVAREPDQAVSVLKRALILDPRNVDAHLALGLSWYTQRHLDKALRQFNRAIRLQPWNAQAHFFRAGVHQVNHDLERARADYKRAAVLAPDSPDITLALARCVFQQGDRAEARRIMETYVLLHPEDRQVRARLGSLPKRAPRRPR